MYVSNVLVVRSQLVSDSTPGMSKQSKLSGNLRKLPHLARIHTETMHGRCS